MAKALSRKRKLAELLREETEALLRKEAKDKEEEKKSLIAEYRRKATEQLDNLTDKQKKKGCASLLNIPPKLSDEEIWQMVRDIAEETGMGCYYRTHDTRENIKYYLVWLPWMAAKWDTFEHMTRLVGLEVT